MPAPSIPLKTDSVVLDGITVTFRCLTRQEVIEMGAIMRKNKPAADPYLVSKSLDVPLDEATAWLDGLSNTNAQLFMTAALRLSDLIGPEGSDPKENRKTRRANMRKSSSATPATPSTTSLP